ELGKDFRKRLGAGELPVGQFGIIRDDVPILLGVAASRREFGQKLAFRHMIASRSLRLARRMLTTDIASEPRGAKTTVNTTRLLAKNADRNQAPALARNN